MKKLLFLLISLSPFIAYSQALELPYSIKITNPKPVDYWYYESDGTPYENTSEVTSSVVSAIRYKGQTFFIVDREWWFKDGITNSDLVEKSSGGSGTSLTRGSGTTLSNDSIHVTGSLTKNMVISDPVGTRRIAIGNDLSGGNKAFSTLLGASAGFYIGVNHDNVGTQQSMSFDEANGIGINGTSLTLDAPTRINYVVSDVNNQPGSPGQVYTSNGGAAAPTWEDPTGADGTNVTTRIPGIPKTASFSPDPSDSSKTYILSGSGALIVTPSDLSGSRDGIWWQFERHRTDTTYLVNGGETVKSDLGSGHLVSISSARITGIATLRYDSINNWYVFASGGGSSGGGSGSGTVNTGAANRLAYYASSGTTVDDLTAITANRALVSDANGLPVHATTTATEIGYVNGLTSSAQTQLNAKQTLDATLTALAGLTITQGSLIVGTGTDAFTVLAKGTALQNIRMNSGATAPEWYTQTFDFVVACSDEVTPLTSGTSKISFRMPRARTLVSIKASLTTAQTSGSIVTVDVNESGSTILSTKLTFDNTESTTTTAATAAVISDSSLASDAIITVDIDGLGDGTAKGLKITFEWN